MCLTCYECTKCGAVLHKDCHRAGARSLECARGNSTAGRLLRPTRSVRRLNVSLEVDDDAPPRTTPSPQASPVVSDDAPGSPAPQRPAPPPPRMPSYLSRRSHGCGSAGTSSGSVSPAVNSEDDRRGAKEAETVHEDAQEEAVQEEPVVEEEEPVEEPVQEKFVEEAPVEEPAVDEELAYEEPVEEEPVEEPVQEEFVEEEPVQDEEPLADEEPAYEEEAVQEEEAVEEEAVEAAPEETREQVETQEEREEGVEESTPADDGVAEAKEGEEEEVEEQKESPEEERKRKRALAVQELVETEMAYYQDLLVVVSVYLDPLKNNPKTSSLVTPIQMRDIFSNFEVFPQLHSDLLSQLLQPNSTVADSFLQYADYFRMYVMYCNNLDKQDATVNNLLATSPPFAAFARVCRFAFLQTVFSLDDDGVDAEVFTGMQAKTRV